MKTKTLTNSCLLACLSMIMSGSPWAASAKDIVISPMLIHITPAEEKEPVITDLNNSAVPGVDLSASSETIPGLGLTYFVSEKLALETYLALPPTHDVSLSGLPGLDKVATASMLPFAIMGQYHHALPETRLTLVGGVGLIYTMFRDIDVTSQVTQLDPTIKFTAEDTFGLSFQAGVQYKLDDKFHLRATYTKMLLDVDVDITTSVPTLGNLSSTLGLDPDIFMIGMAYEL